MKNDKLKEKEWSKSLNEIVQSEKDQDIKLPVLLLDNNIEWEFEVFSNLESLINHSIFSHWSGITPIDSKLDAIVIDSKGLVFKIENDCYNKKLKIGYSYPKRFVGEISISDLKKKISKGYKEYIEVFEPDFKNLIVSGMELINSSSTFYEIICLVENELNLEKLKNVG
ncbi:hypothetical protein [Psychroserpens ponticola]|uniref:Uncharacterized protein n=1 Tax=Psychroserpens ponticola TaxID=2932268 RepID=A0ABY7S2X5_9FLAO|nr:hypothetical protein [Psychroserpens ponticola]WCO03529.1 hypothetical protein MUN68_008475 [Psychroserpens ponticola]